MNPPQWLWSAWVAGGLVWVIWFVVMETVAIVNRAPGDTLTEVVRAIHVPAVVWFLFFGLVISLCVWLLAHFTVGERFNL